MKVFIVYNQTFVTVICVAYKKSIQNQKISKLNFKTHRDIRI